MALPAAAGAEVGFTSVVGTAIAAGEDDVTGATSVVGNSDGLLAVAETPSCDSAAGGGRSSLDIGGIMMSNILSETLAHERRLFLFSSAGAGADTSGESSDRVDVGSGADGGPLLAEDVIGCGCCVCGEDSVISVMEVRFHERRRLFFSTTVDVGSEGGW